MFNTRQRGREKLNLFIDTCVLPRSQLETGRVYRDRFGDSLGFELLMMFDLPSFEENLKRNLDLLAGGPLLFHEPVWGVEHSAPRGSAAWEKSMYHLRLTKKYAEILRPFAIVFHLNNRPVPPVEKEIRLRTALNNLEEMREMFHGTQILVENTGTKADGTILLDQDEFTALCRSRQQPVLIDVGHANTNSWNLPRLIRDMKGLIGGFHLHNNDGIHDLHNRLRNGTLDMEALIACIDQEVPEVPRVIEYSRPAFHGDPLLEDISYMLALAGKRLENEQSEECKQAWCRI